MERSRVAGMSLEAGVGRGAAVSGTGRGAVAESGVGVNIRGCPTLL